MRLRSVSSIGLLSAAVGLGSCDGITTGQLQEDPEPPVLVKIMVQDEAFARGIATDLLDKTQEIRCSDTEPCPAGDPYGHPGCVIPEGATDGVCPDPLKPEQTPPAIGIPVACGGFQVRLVFSKTLDPAAVETTATDMTGAITYRIVPGVIELDGPDGKELNFDDHVVSTPFVPGDLATGCAKYYDPAGSPTVTSDIFFEPYGPALVLKPKDPLRLLTTYTIRLDPTKIRDRKGQAVTRDVNGPVQTSYSFTTEGLYASGGSLVKLKGALAPTDAVVLVANAPFDPNGLTVQVTDATGKPVLVEATADLGSNPAKCADNINKQQLDIVPISAPGTRSRWAPGQYTVQVTGVAAADPKAIFASDRFNKVPFKAGFTVKDDKDTKANEDPYHVDNLLLPEQCVTTGGPDMSTGSDGGMAPDGGDGGKPGDGG